MKHFYQDVPGMFNFQNLYKRIVKEAPQQAHFVEVGTFLGKSAAFMAVEIQNSGKDILFDVVDTFEGSPGDEEHAKFVDNRTNDYYSKFLNYMTPVLGFVRPYPVRSVEMAKRYEDQSLDFVYIDAAHDYESVMDDITAWAPKIKTGGYIGGHDYRTNCPGVWKAVGEYFGHKNVEQIRTSWLTKIS